jgi:predicted RNA methylase
VPDRARFTFVDLGCGKGRGLLLAGLEGRAGACAVARKNLKRMKLSGQVIIVDAATYSFRDEPTVVFLYNPFGKTVLRRVVEQMRKVRAPRTRSSPIGVYWVKDSAIELLGIYHVAED